MIKHVVMWKLLDFADDRSKRENVEKMKSLLEALPAKITEVKSLEVGLNTNPKEAYDIILLSEFEDFEALDRYGKHPEHLKVVEFVMKVRESRACVDYFM